MKTEDFFDLAERLEASLRPAEILLCNLDGEDSDFVRLNRTRIRQAGSVRRRELNLQLVAGQRQTEGVCTLMGDPARDLPSALDLLVALRERIAQVPEDPYLSYSKTPAQSERRIGAEPPDSARVVAELTGAAQGLDLVGIWASGELVSGFASSLGHRHWHASTSFSLDCSCFLDTHRAVKIRHSDFSWDPARLAVKLEAARDRLEVMERPARTLAPGRYRAYLAPEAVLELMDMLAWGGFGLKDHRTNQTPLLRLVRGERTLDTRLGIREQHARGLVPSFTPEGFVKPAEVTLIEGGCYRDCLVDSRSGKEYGTAVNAGSGYPESLSVDAGDLPRAEALARLGSGLFIGNLWYLNYADRNDCRITGMTRFGTFWVEDGAPFAPVNAMRFDDSLYHLFGERLEALTRERELILSAETYGGRSTASHLVPGMLVAGIDLTM
jgi:predicted Zn-dependent protease